MFLEMLPATENPAEQNRGVDGRNLGIPDALACIDVGKVIEESTVSRHLLPEEPQTSENSIARIVTRKKSAFFSDAQSGHLSSGCGDTADIGIVVGLYVATILHQASL